MGVRADQHDDAALVVHVGVDPSFDRPRAAALDRFPVVLRDRLIAVDHAHLADLLDPHDIVVEVKAIEHRDSCHGLLLGLHGLLAFG